MEKPAEADQISNSSPNLPSEVGDLHQDNAVVPDVVDHPGAEPKPEMSEDEIRGILEAIASTGKFWQDWEKLKRMLSFWLKQVLSQYPEAKMTAEQQSASLGETYPGLILFRGWGRIDPTLFSHLNYWNRYIAEMLNQDELIASDTLLSFDEGPPFTLQRLCEILLAARNIYPKLSKLALALEKNLLVTSMLTVSVDPYSQTTGQNPEEVVKRASEEQKVAATWAPNGVEHMGGDKDEIMTEVEEADVDDAMTIDMEAIDEMVGPSETNQMPGENR